MAAPFTNHTWHRRPDTCVNPGLTRQVIVGWHFFPSPMQSMKPGADEQQPDMPSLHPNMAAGKHCARHVGVGGASSIVQPRCILQQLAPALHQLSLPPLGHICWEQLSAPCMSSPPKPDLGAASAGNTRPSRGGISPYRWLVAGQGFLSPSRLEIVACCYQESWASPGTGGCTLLSQQCQPGGWHNRPRHCPGDTPDR